MRTASLLLIVGLVSSVWAADITPVKTTYKSFQNEDLERYVWKGTHVVFLTASDKLDPRVMRKLVATFDKVYEFYRDANSREPGKNHLHEGLAPVAEVEQTCGAACGYLGGTGIELTPGVFNDLYQGVAERDEYDQALPYEFGRNFWFYSPQLAPKDAGHNHAFITGYAEFMRFPAIESDGSKVGRFRGRSGDEFKRRVEEMVDLYVANPKLGFMEAPQNPMRLNETDLFAGFCLRLCRENGGAEYAKKLWREVGKRPKAKTAQDAIDNFILAASAAAGKDLTEQFTKQWRWPMSEKARTNAKGYEK